MPWTLPLAQDLGAILEAQTALLPTSWTGAGSSNGVPVHGPVFDRFTLTRVVPWGASLVLFGDVSLDAGRSFTLTAKVMDDTVAGFNGSPRDLIVWGPGTVLSTGVGVFLTGVPWSLIRTLDLGPARRFIRATVTATLSGGGASQSIDIAGVYILGGAQHHPPTAF